MNPNAPIETPDLRALLNAHRDEIFASLNCHQTGTVVSFDAEKQTAVVSTNARRVIYDRPKTENGELPQTPRIIDYPLLTDVPVFFASGGNARLTLPITAGDTCLLMFNDRDIDAWWASGQVVEPNSPRMHSLSDAMAIVGIRSQANKVDDYEAKNAVLRFGDSIVRLQPDGKIEVISGAGAAIRLNEDGTLVASGVLGGTITIKGDGEIELLSTGNARLALKADGTAVMSISGTSNKVVVSSDGSVEMFNDAGARVRIASKVKINGSSGDLLTALNAVVTALTALNAKTGPSAAAQIADASSAISDVLE